MTPEGFAVLSLVVQIVAGAALLLFGRRLFWLFVAVVGFLAGMEFGADLVEGERWLVLGAALLIGLVGAVVAVFLQKAAVVVAGGLALGILALRWAEQSALAAPLPLVLFVVGFVVGAVLVYFLFEWALIVVSAIAGASLMVEPVAMDSILRLILWAVLVAVGVAAQALWARRVLHRREVT